MSLFSDSENSGRYDESDVESNDRQSENDRSENQLLSREEKSNRHTGRLLGQSSGGEIGLQNRSYNDSETSPLRP